VDEAAVAGLVALGDDPDQGAGVGPVPGVGLGVGDEHVIVVGVGLEPWHDVEAAPPWAEVDLEGVAATLEGRLGVGRGEDLLAPRICSSNWSWGSWLIGRSKNSTWQPWPASSSSSSTWWT
jgi:hypothetical protein